MHECNTMKDRILRLEKELVSTASALANEKLRADQSEEQHRMQSNMHAQASEQVLQLKERIALLETTKHAWRRNALTFDAQRMTAMWYLKALVKQHRADNIDRGLFNDVEAFLAARPEGGESVLQKAKSQADCYQYLLDNKLLVNGFPGTDLSYSGESLHRRVIQALNAAHALKVAQGL